MMTSALKLILSCAYFSFFLLEPAAAAKSKSDINFEPLKGQIVLLEAKGRRLKFKTRLELPEKYHAYQERFSVSLAGYPNANLKEATISPVIEFYDPPSKSKKVGIENTAFYEGVFTIPNLDVKDQSSLRLIVNYQACRDDVCLFPVDLVLQHKVTVLEPSFFSFEDAKERGWFFVFTLAFIGGILTSLTPCIFPMIPITLAVIGASSKNPNMGPSKTFALSFSYVLGIALTYATLGVTAALTGNLFGSLLGHPLAIVAISTVFFLMALSMYGLFDLNFMQFNFGGQSMLARLSPKLRAFVIGLLSGLVASPCVGPVLIAMLAYVASTQNALIGFFLLFTFAWGFGILILILGTYSSLLLKIPKSGAWLNISKFVFGTSFLALSIFYASPLLKKVWATTPISQMNTNTASSWKTYSEEELVSARSKKKSVVIDFYADWCAACHELENFTFSNSKIDPLREKFLWLRVDATQDSAELTHLKQKYKVLGLPTVIFLDAQGTHQEELTLNTFEDADKFTKRLEKISE